MYIEYGLNAKARAKFRCANAHAQYITESYCAYVRCIKNLFCYIYLHLIFSLPLTPWRAVPFSSLRKEPKKRKGAPPLDPGLWGRRLQSRISCDSALLLPFRRQGVELAAAQTTTPCRRKSMFTIVHILLRFPPRSFRSCPKFSCPPRRVALKYLKANLFLCGFLLR